MLAGSSLNISCAFFLKKKVKLVTTVTMITILSPLDRQRLTSQANLKSSPFFSPQDAPPVLKCGNYVIAYP